MSVAFGARGTRLAVALGFCPTCGEEEECVPECAWWRFRGADSEWSQTSALLDDARRTLASVKRRAMRAIWFSKVETLEKRLAIREEELRRKWAMETQVRSK